MTDRGAKKLGSAAPSVTWSDRGRVRGADARRSSPANAAPAPSGPIARPPSSGAVIFWLIAGTVAIAALGIYFGSSGYPVFGLGLGFGFAVGAIPYALLVLAHAGASEISTPRARRGRRMTDEEWQRIFGPRTSGPGSWTAEGPAGGSSWSASGSGSGSEEQRAYERLELNPGATMRQITRAYRRLAHSYHPDLTAGLPEPERAAAEDRMKELNAAYDLLRRRHRRAADPV